MTGACELCGKTAPLMQSHVLPAFVFKWLKKSGHIRYAETPNRRTQDGIKQDWLCRDCEDLFNSFETPFAGQIFHPYDANPSIRVRYGGWLLKFCASVSWRSLLYLKREGHLTQLNERQLASADDALLTWSRLLRGEYKHTGAYEVHLLPLGEIEDSRGINFPPNINRYLARTVDINLGASESVCFTFSKLGPFAIFGFIESLYPQQWKGTNVLYKGGSFGPGKYTLPIQLVDYLIDRAARTKSAMEKISPIQQEKVAESIRANPVRFLQSGLFKAMQRDVEMFGSDAFAKFNSVDVADDE
ncbi:hypothetical protein JQ574_28920 [Bradyrhizobium sp. AUGA SZCCT0158]|uniref:hypothetical protein n=1 Tax=Bradyrhizobium sp. AUGA SZCCT0158 TaxID=2807661 RepID=UPI001BACF8E1|nr:hypothetical protein [Bradyrhizobium sp. AUGA SZCCT0158]MBR1200020.1 hypothetical protein [Bradyrhizobium sp. AUGA SZCCT0158]